jgi:hypothetical protein
LRFGNPTTMGGGAEAAVGVAGLVVVPDGRICPVASSCVVGAARLLLLQHVRLEPIRESALPGPFPMGATQ